MIQKKVTRLDGKNQNNQKNCFLNTELMRTDDYSFLDPSPFPDEHIPTVLLKRGREQARQSQVNK